MEIYIDVVIIENFIIDLFILVITAKILKIKTSKVRILIGAIIGGIYAVVMVIPQIKILASVPFQIVVSFFIIFISFKKNKITNIIKGVGVFILVSMVLSGMCFFMTIWESSYSINSRFNINGNTFKNIILSLVIIFLISNRTICYLKERTMVESFIFDVEIELNGVKHVIKGFLDTGNELREPSTNLPCILVEERFINTEDRKEENFYYISYSAIGIKGIIKGIKVDKVRIRREGRGWEVVEAIICPCQEVLSRDEEFNALLSRGII